MKTLGLVFLNIGFGIGYLIAILIGLPFQFVAEKLKRYI